MTQKTKAAQWGTERQEHDAGALVSTANDTTKRPRRQVRPVAAILAPALAKAKRGGPGVISDALEALIERWDGAR